MGVFSGSGAHRAGSQECNGGSVSRYVFKLPDLGEGTVEAEIVGWRVKPGDEVKEEDVICEVMTEKAAVEVPAPVSGRVLSTTGQPGDLVPVGADLIVFETDAGVATEGGNGAGIPAAKQSVAERVAVSAPPAPNISSQSVPVAAKVVATSNGYAGGEADRHRVATSPAIRRRAHEAGVDLSQLSGTGPNGRIVR